VLAKLLGTSFNPFFVAWLALAGGGLLNASYQLLRRIPLFPASIRPVWIDLFLFASVGTAMPLTLIVLGLTQTSAVTGTFLIQFQGPAAILFAMLFLKEKITWRQGIGMLVLLAGSLLVVLRSFDLATLSFGNPGELLIIAGAVGIGLGLVFGKRLSGHGDSLQISTLRLLIGAVLLLPFVLFQPQILLSPLSWELVGIFALYIVSNFCLAYLTQQEGLRWLPAWEAATIMQTVPLFATFFAIVLLHDSLTIVQVIGGVIALVGSLMVTWK